MSNDAAAIGVLPGDGVGMHDVLCGLPSACAFLGARTGGVLCVFTTDKAGAGEAPAIRLHVIT